MFLIISKVLLLKTVLFFELTIRIDAKIKQKNKRFYFQTNKNLIRAEKIIILQIGA